MTRQCWIDMKGDLATTLQCELAGVSRATMYAHQKPKVADQDDLLLSRLIDEEYTRHPFYGTLLAIFMKTQSTDSDGCVYQCRKSTD